MNSIIEFSSITNFDSKYLLIKVILGKYLVVLYQVGSSKLRN